MKIIFWIARILGWLVIAFGAITAFFAAMAPGMLEANPALALQYPHLAEAANQGLLQRLWFPVCIVFAGALISGLAADAIKKGQASMGWVSVGLAGIFFLGVVTLSSIGDQVGSASGSGDTAKAEEIERIKERTAQTLKKSKELGEKLEAMLDQADSSTVEEGKPSIQSAGRGSSGSPRACGWETNTQTDPIDDTRISRARIRSNQCRQGGMSLTLSCKNEKDLTIQILWPRPIVDILDADDRPNGKAARVTVRFGESQAQHIGMALSASYRRTTQLSDFGRMAVGVNAGLGSLFGGSPIIVDWSERKFVKILSNVDQLVIRSSDYDNRYITGRFNLEVRKDQFVQAVQPCLD
jgi:hypothetical protein